MLPCFVLFSRKLSPLFQMFADSLPCSWKAGWNYAESRGEAPCSKAHAPPMQRNVSVRIDDAKEPVRVAWPQGSGLIWRALNRGVDGAG